MRTTFTEELHRVRPAASESDLGSGPSFALGARAVVGDVTGDVTLYYVKAGAAAVTDGDVVGGGSPYHSAAATDEAVTAYKDTGEMEWVYIKASTAIRRGDVLVNVTDANVVTPFVCVPSLAGDDNLSYKVVAVAQHNIPAGSYGWALRRGVGVCKTDGGVVDGDGLSPDGTVGQADTATASSLGVFGHALTDDGATASGFADVASTTLVKAMLNCQG